MNLVKKSSVLSLTLIMGLVMVISMCVLSLSGTTSNQKNLKTPQYVSAKPGPIEITQPDGTQLTILLKGDERSHYASTTDGYTLLRDGAGIFYYAELAPNNDLVISPYKARNTERRSRKEERFLNKIEKHLSYSERQLSESGLSADGSNLLSLSGTFPSTGTRKYLMILVNFSNKSFVRTANDFSGIMNGASNSFKKFYQDNSFNQLNITTSVVGPYTLSGSMATYGGNNTAGNDTNPRLMVQEAVDLANSNGVDFSQYDNDNDGNVDGIMVVHAGYGEEAGAAADTIWSHRWTLSSYSRNYDGVTINDYTTVPELAGTSGSTVSGIGVICHEFGHNLGLPDYYDTDGASSGGSAWHLQKWDVMASGSWNDSGNTPALHSAYSKWQMGWITPTQMSSASAVTVRSSTSYKDAFYFNSAVSGEFFLVENRQQSGWDAYLPGHGLLIYHVDENYMSSRLSTNKVNADPSHQGYDLEEADNTRTSGSYGGDPFPGTSNKTSFTDTTTPNAKAWNNSNSAKPITNIVESGGSISFSFMGGGGTGPGYCTSTSSNFSEEWISRVRVADLDNSSSGSAYTDFTSKTANLSKGASVSVTLNTGYSGSVYNEGWTVFIDYNQDGDFADSGETVFTKTGSTSVSGSFTVSSSALTGTTRMRVSMKYNAAPTACETLNYGEVEDYTVDISSGGSTTYPPVAAFTANTTTIDAGGSVSFTDQSTNTPTSWSWNFGDSSTSIQQNPSHTYNAAGTYTVTLTATNSAGSDGETKTNYITVNSTPLTYCASKGSNSSYEWLARVRVGSLDKSSGAAGYSDHTTDSVTLTRNNSVSVTLNPGFASTSYSEYYKIWIDLNKDGDFNDAGEELFSSNGTSSVSGSLTVPSSASTGTTRMRVTMKYNGAPTSCETFPYGEVEDYTVVIQ